MVTLILWAVATLLLGSLEVGSTSTRRLQEASCSFETLRKAVQGEEDNGVRTCQDVLQAMRMSKRDHLDGPIQLMEASPPPIPQIFSKNADGSTHRQTGSLKLLQQKSRKPDKERRRDEQSGRGGGGGTGVAAFGGVREGPEDGGGSGSGSTVGVRATVLPRAPCSFRWFSPEEACSFLADPPTTVFFVGDR